MSKQEYLLLAGFNYPVQGGKEGEEVRHEAGEVVTDFPARVAKEHLDQGNIVRVGKRIEALIKEHEADENPEALIAAVRQEKGIDEPEVLVIEAEPAEEPTEPQTAFQPDAVKEGEA